MAASCQHYIDGKHNESVFNSCPIHNSLHPFNSELKKMGWVGYGIDKSCHIGNEGMLYQKETISLLLNEVASNLLFERGYTPTPIDIGFVSIYRSFYNNDIIKRILLM